MKAPDLLKWCVKYCSHLDEKKLDFVMDLQRKFIRSKGRFTVSPVQHKYLQDCYDLATAREFGLAETMKPDAEHFRRLAIKKKRTG